MWTRGGIMRENRPEMTWKITFSACSLAGGKPYGDCRLILALALNWLIFNRARAGYAHGV